METEIKILKILEKQMNQSEILEKLKRKEKYRPFLIRVLQRMEKQNWIESFKGQDKRFKLYSRIEKGDKLLKIWKN